MNGLSIFEYGSFRKGRRIVRDLYRGLLLLVRAVGEFPAEFEAPLIVLCVTDNMAAMLDDLGHKVFEASSAREALAVLRRESGISL